MSYLLLFAGFDGAGASAGASSFFDADPVNSKVCTVILIEATGFAPSPFGV
jgi:hypothetical protein